jgi:hypothetical protein
MAHPTATVESIAQATPKRSYTTAGPIDPTRVYPRFGPLPAVVEVRHQSGSWDTPGRTRKLLLSDGGHVVETITDADSPTYFAYELSEFQKLFGKLVAGARAEWHFEGVAGGTRIRWTYTFRPRAGRGWVVAAIVRLFWAPYMRRVLPSVVAAVESRSGLDQ